MPEVMPNDPTLSRYQPYPANKNSAVEWLGGLPAHWDVKRLWQLTPSRRTMKRCEEC